MKKALLGTTALIAGGLIAGSVMAADLEPAPLPAPVDEGWDVSVGGFASAHFFYFGNNVPGGAVADQNQSVVHWDSEIFFDASTTLANGIRIAVRVELEGINAGGGTPVDEAFLAIQGNFGRFEIGANDSALNGLDRGGPGYGYLGVDGSTFTSFNGAVAPAAATEDHDGFSGDSNKVTYYTPRFSGFQAGVSFTPNDTATGGSRASVRTLGTATTAKHKNVFAAAANYSNQFNDVSVAFSAGFETGKANTAGRGRTTNWATGGSIGMAGFTVGGNYSRAKGFGVGGVGALRGKSRVWIVSASYGTGPWAVGAGYLNSRATATGVVNKFTRFGGGATYSLGTGVALTADVNREKFTNGIGAASVKGWVSGVGIVTAF